MSDESLAQTGSAKAGNGMVSLDHVDARLDYLADDMRRDGWWRMIAAIGIGSLMPVALLLASHELAGTLKSLVTLPILMTPSWTGLFIAVSIALALLHFTLDTRARQRHNKAVLLLIKSDVLSARLAAGYPQSF